MYKMEDVCWLKSVLPSNQVTCTTFVSLINGDPNEKIPGVVGTFFMFFEADLKAIIEATLSVEQWVEAGKAAKRFGLDQGPEFAEIVKNAEQSLQVNCDEEETETFGGHLYLVVNK